MTCSIPGERSQGGGEFIQTFDADFGGSQRHASAVALVEHPVRQFSTEVRPFVRVNALQILVAPVGRHLQCSSEQRVPAVGNRRVAETVC